MGRMQRARPATPQRPAGALRPVVVFQSMYFSPAFSSGPRMLYMSRPSTPDASLARFSPSLASRAAAASATKMCRSVMVKGLEAMVIESFTAARHYSVEDAVIASLQETFPGIDWEKQGAYFFQRVIEHGRRRSEEMHESANTVREAGMPAFSAQGTAERQAWMADRADAGSFGERGAPGFARAADWRAEADRLLQSLKEPTA